MSNDTHDDERLGLGADITRRDILNSTVLGSGAALLGAACPAAALAQSRMAIDLPATDTFTGYGGIGDYARANGNTYTVVNAAHRIRDGYYQAHPPKVEGEAEHYDLVIVGGGLTGLMAAWQYRKRAGSARRVLILENHPIFGGEARQNEFEVNGTRLIGPQGSNDFYPPVKGSGTPLDEFFADCNIPYEYRFQDPEPGVTPLRFATDNYENMDGFGEQGVDVAYRFDAQSGAAKAHWVNNVWNDGLKRTPFPPRVRADLLRWRGEFGDTGVDDPRALDAITYKHYLENVKGYDPAVTRFADPIVGLLAGVSSDAACARVGHHLVMGGPFKGYSYPGGNATFGRHLVRKLIPDSMPGDFTFEQVNAAPVNFASLDREGQPTRIRLGATAIGIEHLNRDPATRTVVVSYEQGGVVRQVRAGAAISCIGGWVAKHVLKDIPDDIAAAYDEFLHAPALIANVALTNWRFLYKLGAPAARWMDDGTMFGFCANIRRSMIVGDYDPPLHPDKPAVLTFYMGLYTPGHSARDQGSLGRMRLLGTSYADYERTIRRQMGAMFADVGFDPKRDIAGIILNRWGHARLIQPPGFYYGKDGKPSPLKVVERGYGRIAIAHSELNGAQNYTGAFQHATRAAEQVLAFA
jgi:spermidine dehydrogenase